MSTPRRGADAAVGVTQALAVLLVHLWKRAQLTVGTCTFLFSHSRSWPQTLVISVPGGQLFRLLLWPTLFSLPPLTSPIMYLFPHSPTRHIFKEHVLCARHREHYD